MGRHGRKEFEGERTGIELEMRTAPPSRRFDVERGHHYVDGGQDEDEEDLFVTPASRVTLESHTFRERYCCDIHPCLVLLLVVAWSLFMMKVGMSAYIVVRHILSVSPLDESKEEALDNHDFEAN